MNSSGTNDVIRYRIADLARIIARYRKSIAIIVGFSCVVGIVTALLVSRQFKSVTRVLPPKETNMLSGLSGLSTMMKSLPGGLGSLAKKNDDAFDYIAILRSRTVMEEIARKFDLMKVYEISDGSMEKTLKELRANSEIEWAEDNTMEIRVWDTDTRRAADIANAFVDLLNNRSRELQNSEARFNRKFIENRVLTNREDIAKAEEKLQKYQEEKGIMIPMDPSSAGVSSFGELYAMLVKKEIEKDLVRRSMGDDNPQYQQLTSELAAIRSQLSKFPKLGIESLRLYRELYIQQKIMELIVPMYEQAKVNENKSVPVAYILDTAIPGERPDRPKRLFILGIIVFLGIITSAGYIVFDVQSQSFRNNGRND